MADEYYNNKIVTTDGDVLMDVTQDTATPETVLEGETFHLRSGAPATGTYRPSEEIEARLRATVGHSSKNLLKITADTKTTNGITFTVDKQAGTITASGTATADAQLDFQGSSPKSVSTIKNGLIYSCEGTSSNLVCAISYYNRSGACISEQRATTSGTIITIPSNANSYKFWVRKRPAAGSETFIFKPMLREASISDDAFEAYQEPTYSLIETKARAYLTSTVGHACKNLLELSGTSGTTSGVYFTIDKISGTVKTENTSTGQIIKLIGEVTNNSDTVKNYYLSGGANNGTSTSYYLYAIDDSTGSRPKQWDGVTNSLSSYGLNDSVQIQIPAGHKIGVRILIRNGVNADGLVFKPMLRDGSISDDNFEPYQKPTDERISSLDIAVANVSQYVPDPDEGIYWITIIDHYSTTWNNQFDIYISTPNSNDRGYFFGASEDYPIPKPEVKLPRFHSYKGKAISFGIIAGVSDPVMAISSNPGMFSSTHTTSRWDKVFDVDTFLDFCDVKDGSATNYMHIHLCNDGGIRSQAEYEAYIGN